MVFSSFTFLFYFLPIFLLVYFLFPAVGRNAVLFGASLLFYFYGVREHPAYLLLILVSVFGNYMAARLIAACRQESWRRVWLLAGMTWNIGSLFWFKYLDFLSANMNALLKRMGMESSIPAVNLPLPIGISFYTFQISSYLLDVYWKKVPVERSILTLGTYLCMFPQLIAGPIVTYSQVQARMQFRIHSYGNVEEGLREFTIGLALKVLIANRVGSLWTQMGTIGYDSISCPLAWLGIAAFTLQIYFDFYGYSLMARGLGLIMGFQFPDNFRNPYLARSMTEFWRRWHMTLGGAYMAETFRSGLENIAPIQAESAQSLGLNRVQAFRYVILPQAVSSSVPGLLANVIFLLKETSVFSTISLMDLMFTAKDLIGMYAKTMECLTLLVIFYLIMLLPVSILGSFVERRLRHAEFGN